MPLIKILSRHSLSAIEHSIRYVLNEGKTAASDGEVVQPILQNLRCDPTDIEGLANELIANESYRKLTSNRVFMFHEIVSFGSGDKSVLTPEIVQDVTQKYLQLRGDDLVALAIPHFNTESVHCHILSGATRFRDSVSSGLRKSELGDIKVKLENYVNEKYPQLEHSSIFHGQAKAYVSEKQYQLEKRGLSIKQELKELVVELLSSSNSLSQFIDKLAKNGYLAYERNRDGKITGIVSESGRKHRFSTLGIAPSQIQQLETASELSREEKLLQRLKRINQNTRNENDNQRE